ncbi:Putative adhesin [Alteromonadaceae bacterium Bs31]|nr:Putative adhesin [Alteromonadaceae bacterium Bs31]
MNKKPAQLALAALSIATCFSALASKPLVEEQSFELDNVETLQLSMDHAHISFKDGERGELKVTLKQDLREGKPENCLHKIMHSKHGSKLKVSTGFDSPVNNGPCNVYREIEILADQTALLILRMKQNHGSLSVDNFSTNKLALDITHSKLELHTLHSDDSTLELKHTDARINNIETKALVLKGAHGELNIRSLNASEVQLQWAHGDIAIEKNQVTSFDAQQRHGDIRIDQHLGQQLNLKNGHGHLAVKEAQVEMAELRNSHGSIDFTGSSRAINFSNSHGSTHLKQQEILFTQIKGKASHSSIALAIPKGSICDLNSDGVKNIQAELFRGAAACESSEKRGAVKLSSSHGKVKLTAL